MPSVLYKSFDDSMCDDSMCDDPIPSGANPTAWYEPVDDTANDGTIQHSSVDDTTNGDTMPVGMPRVSYESADDSTHDVLIPSGSNPVV